MSARLSNNSGDNNVTVMAPPELTLIVAATRNMGIGRAGTLPWTGLRKEMAYFARVTKNVGQPSKETAKKNAVIMGRKTWDSIPERFRPLKERLNIVLSRSNTLPSPTENPDGPVYLSFLSEAVELAKSSQGISKLFVIGGAEIYKAAMELEETRRILITRIKSDFDCDTFFPVIEEGLWKRKSRNELGSWVGEIISEGVQEENGVRYEFEMYEKA